MTATTLTQVRIPTPLGDMIAVATDRALVRLEFARAEEDRDGNRYGPRPRDWPLAPEPGNDITRQAAEELAAYFEGGRRQFDVPLEPHGTPFQRQVWEALRRIPYGETRSYGEQAASIGRARAVRAVAQANGANPIAVIVPCHRVIGADGSMTGYGAGVWRKERLLAIER